MRPDAPYFIILLCLTPDDFTRQGESATTQWVKKVFSWLLFLQTINTRWSTKRLYLCPLINTEGSMFTVSDREITDICWESWDINESDTDKSFLRV
jgi:hypothetical protein